MWRSIAIFLAGGVLGTAFGVAIGFLEFPYVFPPPEAMDTLTAEEHTTVVASATFVRAKPTDPIHYGKGTVTLYDEVVFLGSDFEFCPGPAFHVYLVPKAQVSDPADVKGAMFVDLGNLRAFKGSQNYGIPAGVDLMNYPSVVIWVCRVRRADFSGRPRIRFPVFQRIAHRR